MSRPLNEVFYLEPLGENCFRAGYQPLGGGRIFGGQLLSQALMAAGYDCSTRLCHSLHGYFLRTGKPDLPLDYLVEVVQEGRSFSSRRVSALQQGRPIFQLSCSFHLEEEGLESQALMPCVPRPEELLDLTDPEQRQKRQRSSSEMRVEIRPVPAGPADSGAGFPSTKAWWLRIIDPLPDLHLFHQAALAYASDFGLIGTAREVHGIGFRQPGVLVASLDHAIWFHRPFRWDDWLLHVMDCPNTAGARGYARGQIFSRDGRLLASTCQEGLIRLKG